MRQLHALLMPSRQLRGGTPGSRDPKIERCRIPTNSPPTGALLDRLTHHVHILELNGESYRLEHSKKARQPAATPAS